MASPVVRPGIDRCQQSRPGPQPAVHRYHGLRDIRGGDDPPMPHVATSPQNLIETIRPAAHLDGDRLVIDDERTFRDGTIRDLAWTAAFSTDDPTTEAAQWLVWEASQEL